MMTCQRTPDLTNLLAILFLIVSAVALGSKYLLDWNAERERRIRDVSINQGYLIRDALEEARDDGYQAAKEKYASKDDNGEDWK